MISQLSNIISNQLTEQPLVVLPGFGGFVKNELGASIDEHRNRIHPPKNTVVFNPRLTHNDGLLIAAIAIENEVSYVDADKWLTDAISELRFRLSNKETVLLEGIGELSKTLEGTLEFKGAESPNIQDVFFGLKPLSLHPVEKDNVDKVKELVAADGPVATKVRTLPVKRIARYAAAAIAVGFLAWLPIQQGVVGNGKMLVHQLNPFAVTTPVAYEGRTFDEKWLTKGFEKEDLLAEKFQQEYLSLYLTDDSKNAIVVRTDAIPSDEVRTDLNDDIVPENKPVLKEATSYKVIAASFRSKTEAADYVAKMIKRGFGAEYAGTESGKHLVAYGTYSSLDDAEKMLKSVSLSNKEARILADS
jgi:nucleoid DNA-binding protein